jgi:hypothetical protein
VGVSGDESDDESDEDDGYADLSQLIDDGSPPAADAAARVRYLRAQLSEPSPECQLPTPVRVGRYRAQLRCGNVQDTPSDDGDFETRGGVAKRGRGCDASEEPDSSLDSFICDDDEPVSALPSTGNASA